MNSREIKEKVKSLKKLYDEEKFDEAHAESESFVLELFKEKKYKDIVEADKKLESVPIIKYNLEVEYLATFDEEFQQKWGVDGNFNKNYGDLGELEDWLKDYKL